MHGRYLLAIAIFVTTSIAVGCGGRSGTIKDVAAGQLAVSPSKLNFGKVPVEEKATIPGILKAGNSSVTVRSADWSGEGYSVSGVVFPLTVPAGQSISFKVTFAPNKAGSSPGTISFISDALNSPHREVFSGNGTQVGTHSVTLSWRSNPSSAAGYNIYRGIAPKGPFTRINRAVEPSPNFTDAAVQPGQTYFYVTTDVDKHGRESKYSNQVQVMVPNS